MGGILYYTIIYPTAIPTPTEVHSTQLNSFTRMFDVYLKIYSGMEREKDGEESESINLLRLYHIRLLVLLLYVIHYKI